MRLRVRSLFHRSSVERELREELQYHLDQRTEELVATGMTEADARRTAAHQLPGLEQIKEECRDMRKVRPIEDLVRDVAFGARLLRKSPGFTVVVLIVLALGIGANTALFSLFNQVLLRSLPVANPDELVVLVSKVPRWGTFSSFSYPMFRELRDKNTVLTGLLAHSGADLNVGYGGQSTKAVGEVVSTEYFNVLGVRPWLGRFIDRTDEERAVANPVAVLTYSCWQQRFGGDRSIVDRDIVLNGHATRIIGIAPPGFYGTELNRSPDVFVPVTLKKVFEPVPRDRFDNPGQQWLRVMGRLKPGVSIQQAQAAIDLLHHQVREREVQALPPRPRDSDNMMLETHVELQPGAHGFGLLQRELAKALRLLLVISAIILVITCANLANMLLARNAARAQEITMRLALGASRLRLVRQWLTESALLSLLGGGLGVVVSVWCQGALLSFLPVEQRANLSSHPDVAVLAFAIAVSVITGLLFGLAPALQVSRASLHHKASSENAGGFRAGLVALQVALCLPLLVIAGLFLASLRNTRTLPTGFESKNVILATIDPSLNGYDQPRVRHLFQQTLQAARALPGVEAAGFGHTVVLSGSADQMVLTVEGFTQKASDEMTALVNTISPGYFEALRLPLVSGRYFNERDAAGSRPVGIINETIARQFFPGKNPIGMRFGTDTKSPPNIEVIGVVRDAKYTTITEKPERQYYIPMSQNPELRDMTLHIRASGDPRLLVELLRSKIRAIDPNVPLFNVKTLEQGIDESLSHDRLVAWLSIALGALATALCAIGLYGVIAFSVARRTREVGIRMALGAQRRDILALIVKRVTLLLTGGVLIGAIGALAGTRVIGSLLFGVTPTDPGVFAAATAILLLAAAVAAYLPARRALQVNPSVALRYE